MVVERSVVLAFRMQQFSKAYGNLPVDD